MSTINTSLGRYSLSARNAGDHIKGSIAINDEGGTQLTSQEFNEHDVDDVINNVIFPLPAATGLSPTSCVKRWLKRDFPGNIKFVIGNFL